MTHGGGSCWMKKDNQCGWPSQPKRRDRVRHHSSFSQWTRWQNWDKCHSQRGRKIQSGQVSKESKSGVISTSRNKLLAITSVFRNYTRHKHSEHYSTNSYMIHWPVSLPITHAVHNIADKDQKLTRHRTSSIGYCMPLLQRAVPSIFYSTVTLIFDRLTSQMWRVHQCPKMHQFYYRPKFGDSNSNRISKLRRSLLGKPETFTYREITTSAWISELAWYNNYEIVISVRHEGNL